MTFNNNKHNFNKKEIEDVLKTAKMENKKFLFDVLSIKKISLFDVSYIMNRLNLTDDKIKIIKMALSKYDFLDEINQTETYSDFLFRVVRNIEKLEKNHNNLLNEITNAHKQLNNISTFIDFLVSKSSCVFKETQQPGYVFSTIYTENY